METEAEELIKSLIMASTQTVGEESCCSVGCTDIAVVRWWLSEGKTGRPEKPQTETGGVGWVVVESAAVMGGGWEATM